MNPITAALLRAIHDLGTDDDGDPFRSCYGIDVADPDPCPLDEAIAAWLDAGAPDLPPLEEPAR